MTAHTPGPWRIDPQIAVMNNSKTGMFQVAAEPLGIRHLIGVIGNGIHPEVAEANARLIAAAPDLLAALGNGVFLLEARESSSTEKDWIAKARAAIAKAKGE